MKVGYAFFGSEFDGMDERLSFGRMVLEWGLAFGLEIEIG